MRRILSALALSGLVPAARAQVLPPAKLEGRLPEVLATASADDLLQVAIVLADQVPGEELRALGPAQSKLERRAYVKARLWEVARASQADLLALLESRAAVGEAEGVRPLWIHNVVGVRATPALVREIAQRDDVAYVHYDPPRGAEILCSPTPSPSTSRCSAATCASRASTARYRSRPRAPAVSATACCRST